MNAPFRPVLRYLGGKWRLAPWIVEHFPAHRTYVEPFGGAASVLLRKRRSYAEVYNDLDSDVFNRFQVLRGRATADELLRQVELTPFSREEFDAAYVAADAPIERARRMIVRSYMGHGSNATDARRKVGFRGAGTLRGRSPERDWANYPPALAAVIERLQGVRFEHSPASDVIAQFDGPETLIYADPPYLHETRSAKRIKGALYNAYPLEMMDDEHVVLLDQLCAAKSMVVLSGYPAPLYDRRLSDWTRVERAAMADGAAERIEVLWINPAASRALRVAADPLHLMRGGPADE